MNKQQKQVYKWLNEKPGYLKTSALTLQKEYFTNIGLQDVYDALKRARKDKLEIKPSKPINMAGKTNSSIPAPKAVKSLKNGLNPNNVIFIPDLHAPFIKKGVLEWILDEQRRYNCGKVIFAGDIIDGHAWNYHEHDPDGMSVGDELEAAKKQLKEWYKAFPNATSLLGNHDLLISRKAKTAGLSSQFIRDFGSVIEAPKTWDFKLETIIDNVLYHHGSVGDAFKVAKDRRISTCQGHLHSKSFVQWSVSDVDAIFGMQIGWGADRDKYAFDYGKSFVSKPVLSCGIVLDRGRTPIVKLMPL